MNWKNLATFASDYRSVSPLVSVSYLKRKRKTGESALLNDKDKIRGRKAKGWNLLSW